MNAQRVIITGEIGAGKTSFCQELVRLGQQSGLVVQGILSHAVFEDGQKEGIQAVNVGTGESHLLARKQDRTEGSERLGWAFDDDVVQWSNGVLEQSVPCDLLIVDELGPLEFNRRQGFQQGLQVMDGGQYSAGVTVIRPHLVEQAIQRWPDGRIILIERGENITRRARGLFECLSFSGEGKNGG